MHSWLSISLEDQPANLESGLGTERGPSPPRDHRQSNSPCPSVKIIPRIHTSHRNPHLRLRSKEGCLLRKRSRTLVSPCAMGSPKQRTPCKTPSKPCKFPSTAIRTDSFPLARNFGREMSDDLDIHKSSSHCQVYIPWPASSNFRRGMRPR